MPQVYHTPQSYSFHAALCDWAFEGSNTHFALGVSFIAAIGLIAMAAALGA